MYIEKCLQFDALIFIIMLSQVRYLIFYDKNVFCLTGGIFFNLDEKWVIFTFRIHEKAVFFKLALTSMDVTFWSGEGKNMLIPHMPYLS